MFAPLSPGIWLDPAASTARGVRVESRTRLLADPGPEVGEDGGGALCDSETLEPGPASETGS